MSGISHKLCQIANELDKIESQTNAANARLGGAKAKLDTTQAILTAEQAEFESAKKQVAEVSERKAALLRQIMDLVNTESPDHDASLLTRWAINASGFPVLTLTVKDLGLKVRPVTCLLGAGLYYLGDLVQRNEAELLKIPNFGHKSLNEVMDALSSRSLTLGMKITGWSPPQP